MSKTYEALIKAEQLRAAQDPAALARRVARATEEGEALRAEFRACQEQLAALVERVDAADTIDPATIDDLGCQVARLAARQERLAAEPHQLLEAAVQQFKEEFDRRWAGLQSQSDQVAGLSLRLEQAQAGLRESVESVSARLEHAETIRGADADRLQADVQRLQEGLELFRTALAESERTSAAVTSAQVETLRADLDALRERLAALDDEHRQLRRRGEEQLDHRLHDMLGKLDSLLTGQTQSAGEMDALRAKVAALADAQAGQQHLAENVRRAQASAENAQSRITAIDGAQASNAEASHRQMEKLRTSLLEKVSSLRLEVDAVQSSLAEQSALAAGVEALRTQMAPLVESQARQSELEDLVSGAQSAADEVGRRIAAHEEAQGSTLAALRQQIEAFKVESGAWRDIDAAAQSALTRHEDTAGEIDELRTQLTRIMEAQQRQQQLFEDLLVAPANDDDPRPRDAAFKGSADLANLRRQVVALQANSLNLDALLETRFELLCDILDAQLQETAEEIRGSARAPGALKRLARKILPAAWLRRASSIARLREEER